jgi:hypothetical protein
MTNSVKKINLAHLITAIKSSGNENKNKKKDNWW